MKDKVALQRGFLRVLGFPLSGIPPVLRADPLGGWYECTTGRSSKA